MILRDVCKSLKTEQEQAACNYFAHKDPMRLTGLERGILLMLSCGAKVTGAVLAGWGHLDLNKIKNGEYSLAAITLYNNFCDQKRTTDLPESKNDYGDYVVPLPDLTADILDVISEHMKLYIRKNLDEITARINEMPPDKKERYAEINLANSAESRFDYIYARAPIVCDDDDLMMPADPFKLADAAKNFLIDIGVTEAQISSTEEYLGLVDAEEDTMVGKSVAAYIFRANLGTVLSCSDMFFRNKQPNMTSAVINYILGLSNKEMDMICSDYGINPGDIWGCAQKLIRIRPILNRIRCEHCGNIVNESLIGMMDHHATIEPWNLHPSMTCPHCEKVLLWFEEL